MHRFWAFIFLGAGAAVCLYGITLVLDARACANWPQVEGRVLSAVPVIVAREKDKTSYAPEVTYAYAVKRKRYESSRLTIVPRNYLGELEVKTVLANYPVGSSVMVHYDPKDHANCVLVPAANGVEWAYPIGGLLLAGAGLFFLKNS